MRRHGCGNRNEIATDVKTRTANQGQSHAQKYFLRQAKSDSELKKRSIYDVTDVDMQDDTTSLSAVIVQQSAGSALVPAPNVTSVVILSPSSYAVSLASIPPPSSNHIIIPALNSGNAASAAAFSPPSTQLRVTVRYNGN